MEDLALTKLLGGIGAPKDLSDIDSFPWLWAFLTTCDPTQEEYIDSLIVELSLAMAKKGEFGIADAGVIEISNRLDFELDRYLRISLRLCQAEPRFLSTRLFSHYLNCGGLNQTAFGYEISRLYNLNQYQDAISVFRESEKWHNWKTYDEGILFSVSNAFGLVKEIDENFRILKFLLEQNPSNIDLRQNMSYLGLILKHEPANKFIREFSKSVAASFVNDSEPDLAPDVGVVVDLEDQGEAAIIRALKRYGLCHVKNGANSIVADEILLHVQAIKGVKFPIQLTPYTRSRCGELLCFDAASVVNAVLPRHGEIDEEASSIRVVDPANERSFTPFHQDATAFQRAVVNIWTPLTPAGGDYPTMEFVKRRVNNAEDTLPGTDDYNLVRIDENAVLEKFKGELYEPHDVMPGECIIFLGTTIHRSTMRKGATETRYSLEIRWS